MIARAVEETRAALLPPSECVAGGTTSQQSAKPGPADPGQRDTLTNNPGANKLARLLMVAEYSGSSTLSAPRPLRVCVSESDPPYCAVLNNARGRR